MRANNPQHPDHDRARRRALVVDLLVLLALCALLFGFRLGKPSIWDVDEGMHAAMAKVMVQSGDWTTPIVNGEPFYDKPLLFPWLVAASFEAFGFTSLAARLPAAILGTLSVLATFVLGRSMFGRRAALLGGVVLATSFEVIVMSRVVVHDIALVACVTVALACWWLAWRDAPRRNLLLLGFWLAAGLSVLAKGPLGLVLIGLAIGPFLLLERRLADVRRMGLAWGAVVVALVAGPWFLIMMARHPEFAGYFFIQQNLRNFISGSARHPAPFWFYLPAMLAGMLPWSAFLPEAVRGALQDRDQGSRLARRFLLLWAAAMLLFFSIASSKLLSYILPLFPAAALLVGAAWDDLLAQPTATARRRFLVAFGLLLALVAVLVGFVWLTRMEEIQAHYELDPVRIVVPLAILLGGLALAFLLFASRREQASFATVAGTVVVFIAAVSLLVLPPLDPYRSTRAIAAHLDRQLPAGEPMTFHLRLWDSVLFYTDRTARVVRDTDELVARLQDPETGYCVIDREDYPRLPEVVAVSEVVVREGRKLLIRGRTADETATGPRTTR